MQLSRGDRILFYDGYCKLCGGFAAFMIRHDRKRKIHYTPLQDAEVAAFLKPLGIDTAKLDTIVYYNRGKAYTRSTAAIRAVQSLPGIWKLARLLLYFPAFLRDPVYDFTGRNRYHWFGKRTACFRPPGDEG